MSFSTLLAGDGASLVVMLVDKHSFYDHLKITSFARESIRRKRRNKKKKPLAKERTSGRGGNNFSSNTDRKVSPRSRRAWLLSRDELVGMICPGWRWRDEGRNRAADFLGSLPEDLLGPGDRGESSCTRHFPPPPPELRIRGLRPCLRSSATHRRPRASSFSCMS